MRSPAETFGTTTRVQRAANGVARLAARFGVRIEQLEDTARFAEDGRSRRTPEMMAMFATIPGMTNLRRGMYLYWLAYACGAPGDIVEVGVWQGRSTAFLAQACADADAGVVHAIDTFRGNPGKEHLYALDDVEDLHSGFLRNMQRVGLADRVVTWRGASADVADAVRSAVANDGIKLLCIDGDHSYEGARTDIELFADRLTSGSLLVLDDYTAAQPGVVAALNEHLDANSGRYATPVQDKGLLVVRRR